MNINYIEGKNLYLYEKEKDKIKKSSNSIEEYYQKHFRNCISRNPSIDYSNVISKDENKDKDNDNKIVSDINLSKIISKFPSIFSLNQNDNE